jgi:hypothetical protein
MSEHDEQVAVVEYCDLKSIPVYAIPNGGLRRKSEAARLKAEGVSKGVPDLCVPRARGRYHSLYIEMKADGGKPTEEQARWILRLRAEGMCAYVCYGAENAIALIDRYMALGDRDAAV